MENIEIKIQQIKKDFFIYRNGMIADSLRKLYPPGLTIYGLLVAQLMEMAKKYPKSLKLGLALWNDKQNRESRLLALYILPVESIDTKTATMLINDVRSIEEADLLAFKILRNLSFANNLYSELKKEKFEGIKQYCLDMFKKNLKL